MRAISIVLMLFGIYLTLGGAAAAHVLNAYECSHFARDMYLDAIDRNKGDSLAKQTSDFQAMRCAQGDVCVYRDAEDMQRVTTWLTDLYGKYKTTSPIEIGGEAAEECEQALMDSLGEQHGVRQ